MIGTTLVVLDGLSLGTHDGTMIRYLEGSTKGIEEGNLEGLLLSA